MGRHNTEIKDEKIQIKKDFKNYIHNAIPKHYMRYAGIDPYFIPLFGRIYWKRLEVALRLAKKYAPQEKPKIGDFGCGFGILIALLSTSYKLQIIGIDTYPAEILKIAENISNRVSEKQNHFFIRNSMEDLSFKSKIFDMCFSLDVLEHVPKVAKSIKEIK